MPQNVCKVILVIPCTSYSNLRKMAKTIQVFNETTVCCKGEDSGGHPLIYLSLEGVDKVMCPYCSIVFEKIRRH